MEVILSPEREAMVRAKVASGRYADVNEVIDEALRLLDQRDRQARLHAAIDEGLAEIARGEDTDWSADALRQLQEEADEKDRLGLPLNDEGLDSVAPSVPKAVG